MAATEKSVDVGLAEFNALRAEILSRLTTQAALVGVGFTAIGIVFGFVFKEDGDPSLLLAVPPVAAIISMLHASATYTVSVVGDYIRHQLWPYLLKSTDESLPSWEAYVVGRRGRWRNLIVAFLIDGPATALFAAASIFAMTYSDAGDDTIRALGWICTVVTIVAPILLGLTLWAKAKWPKLVKLL